MAHIALWLFVDFIIMTAIVVADVAVQTFHLNFNYFIHCVIPLYILFFSFFICKMHIVMRSASGRMEF